MLDNLPVNTLFQFSNSGFYFLKSFFLLEKEFDDWEVEFGDFLVQIMNSTTTVEITQIGAKMG